MSAPAAREVEAQSLDFDDLEEISATGTLPIFKSRNVRYRSLELTLAKPVLQTVPSRSPKEPVRRQGDPFRPVLLRTGLLSWSPSGPTVHARLPIDAAGHFLLAGPARYTPWLPSREPSFHIGNLTSHHAQARRDTFQPKLSTHFNAEIIMQYALDLDLGLPVLTEEVGETRFVHVEANKLFSDDAVDDEGVAGFYRAEVPADLTDSMAAACALGAFHSNFVVNWPDSFRFTVFDEETGEKLQPGMDVDWIKLAKSCLDVEYMGVKT